MREKISVKWLIEDLSFDDSFLLIEALKKQNIKFQLFKSGELYNNRLYDLYPKEECVVFVGSLNIASKVLKETSWIPGAYYNKEKYYCSNYYPFFGDSLLNRNYFLLPFGDLKRRKDFLYGAFGYYDAVFLRPDRCDKTFTGKLIFKDYFDKDIEYLGYGVIAEHELVVAAQPISIEEEWRFICVNGKIITGSSYKTSGRKESPTDFIEAEKLAQSLCTLYSPDIAWVIDIGLTIKNRFCVVEIGCFSCAGLYKCDRNIIVEEISKAAIKEYESYK